MRRTKFILFSPGPIDGYPPVQYQARLLAAAGCEVEIVTSPLTQEQKDPIFFCPGVKVTCLTPSQAFSGRVIRNASYVRALIGARIRASLKATEICYDPIGVFLSDCTPLKSRRRIAHFHELLQDPQTFLVKRLRQAVKGYQLIVVPDNGRAIHTAATLDLRELPLVLENYPLRAHRPLDRLKLPKRFEVVYCGSLGLDQRLDMIIRSVRDWPLGAHFVMIGNDNRPIAKTLLNLASKQGVADRVHFLGWMETVAAEMRVASADLAVALLDDSFEQWRTALGASNKRFQYMKAGLPQIGDQNPGVPQLIEGNRIGTCLKRCDPAELAGVVTSYMRDHERCRAEGARAFELHQKVYNYEVVFDRLLGLLKEMK